MPQQILPPVKAKGVVHEQIAATAKGLCEEHWEVLAKQNAFFRKYPKPAKFVRLCWTHYIPMARTILTAMLGDPKLDPAMKDRIHAALLLDGTVNPKKMAAPAPVPAFKLTK